MTENVDSAVEQEGDAPDAAGKRATMVKHLLDRLHLNLGQIAKLAQHERHGAIVSTITLQEVVDGAGGVVSNSTSSKTKKKAEETAETSSPKRRGRPAKNASKADAAEPKKRGRKPGKKAVEANEENAPPKRRGRPPKQGSVATTTGEITPKRRGRPSKNGGGPVLESGDEAPPKRRGRPPKNGGAAPKTTEPKKRGRKPGKAVKEVAPKGGKGKREGAAEKKADFGKKKPRLQREVGYKVILDTLKAAGSPCSRSEIETATKYTGVQVRTFCTELADQGKITIHGTGGRSTKYEAA